MKRPTLYVCDGCGRKEHGAYEEFLPWDWLMVTVRITHEHVRRDACSRACAATIIRRVADFVIANDTRVLQDDTLSKPTTKRRPYRG